MGRRREPVERRVLRALVRCESDLAQTADGAGMALEELSDLLATPAFRARAQALRFGEDMRVQFVVSKHRVSAVKALLDLIAEGMKADPAKGEKIDAELVRRAAAELVRATVVAEASEELFARAGDAGEQVVGDAKMLEALGAMGRFDVEDRGRDGGEGEQPAEPPAAGRTGESDAKGGV